MSAYNPPVNLPIFQPQEFDVSGQYVSFPVAQGPLTLSNVSCSALTCTGAIQTNGLSLGQNKWISPNASTTYTAAGSNISGTLGYTYTSTTSGATNSLPQTLAGTFLNIASISSLPVGIYVLKLVYDLTNSGSVATISQAQARIGIANTNVANSYSILQESIPFSMAATNSPVSRVLSTLYISSGVTIYVNFFSALTGGTVVLNSMVLTATRIA